MRVINEIIIHCSDTPAGREHHVDDIRAWHKAQGWKDVGYHYVITLDGKVERGRPLSVAGAHCLGHNSHSIGICYIGGNDGQGHPTDTRTEAQKAALRELVAQLTQLYKCPTYSHHDINPAKACPCFDALEEYAQYYWAFVLDRVAPLARVKEILRAKLQKK